MENEILKLYDKTTLKNIALNKGLTSGGFNGRRLSKMRKQDFIDFIVFCNHNHNNLPITSNEDVDDDDIVYFDELLVDDALDSILQIMNVIQRLENINILDSLTNSTDKTEKKSEERIPNDEDETVPNFMIKNLLPNNSTCNDDCQCEICQKNNDILQENLKANINLQNLENKITCVICNINIRNALFSPCNHLATCITCSKNSMLGKKCPLCRKVFDKITRIFC